MVPFCYTLRWMENIYSSLFPNSDTTREIVYMKGGQYDNDDEVSIGYHPDVPGMFVLRIAIDSLFDTSVKTMFGIVCTTDAGSTWQWVLRPRDVLSMLDVSIDPKHHSIYLAVGTGDLTQPPSNVYGLLKVTPWVSSVAKTRPNDFTFKLWPNPCTDNFNVDIYVSGRHSRVVFGTVLPAFLRTWEGGNSPICRSTLR